MIPAEPVECVTCGVRLPIVIDPDDPEAVRIECVFCGTLYRGRHFDDARYNANIAIEPTPAPAAPDRPDHRGSRG